MLTGGQIEPSDSPWASPVVLVTNKDGSTHFCVDYRRLNALTTKDAYTVPRIDDSLRLLGNQQCFSTMDLASGYWQVAMSPEAKGRICDQQRTVSISGNAIRMCVMHQLRSNN